MKTTGAGTERYMVVLPAAALLAAAILAAGGPGELIRIADRAVQTAWELLALAVRQGF